MRVDARTFNPTGNTEAVTFGLLIHGTVVLDGRRVPAAMSEHYSGERRLIARDASGRHCAIILDRGNAHACLRPVGLTTWVAHSLEQPKHGHGRGI